MTTVKDLAWLVFAGIAMPTIAWTLVGRLRHVRDQVRAAADERDMARMDSDKG